MHVIVYVIDALRADHLSCYGYSRQTSPNIELIAKEGTIFMDCSTVSTWTRPVAASILTGAYPFHHNTRLRNDMFSPTLSIKSLAQIFKKNGFETLGVTAMVNIASEIGFDLGFDEYINLFEKVNSAKQEIERQGAFNELSSMIGEDKEIGLPNVEDINRAFFEWFVPRIKSSTFSFIWSIQPHAPYAPPAEFREYSIKQKNGVAYPDNLRSGNKDDVNWLIDLYDDEIKYNDWAIGNLIARLKELKVYEDTIFVIVGDHGEAFYEHGRFSHGHFPYQELIHVPLILKLNKDLGIQPGEITAPVSIIDIAPTLYQLCGFTEKDTYFDGTSLFPIKEKYHDNIFTETQTLAFHDRYLSVRSGKWKLIKIMSSSLDQKISLIKRILKKDLLLAFLQAPAHYLKKVFYKSDEMLFNLTIDKEEKENLAKINPEITKYYRLQIMQTLEDATQILSENKKYLSEEDSQILNDHLEKLGYL